MATITKLSVLDTIHDFGKECHKIRYYNDFLRSQRENHVSNPETVVDEKFEMNIARDEVINFETLDISNILETDKFCLLIQDVNNEAFKLFLGTLISQNEGGRIQMITDTTNLSQNTFCSIQIDDIKGAIIVTDATKFDRGRAQAIDNICVQERTIEVSLNGDSLNKDQRNLFALKVIKTYPNQIEYSIREFTHQINLDEYINRRPSKLPFYIQLIRSLNQGSFKKTSRLLERLLGDLDILYGLKQGQHYQSKQELANILFDLKRSGDQLQVKTAKLSNTVFVSNDRISASYAKAIGVPTIRTTLQEGEGPHRLRKYYFYNFKVEQQDSYIERTKKLIINKINEIMNNIESFRELQKELVTRVIQTNPFVGIEPFILKIKEFLDTIRRLRGLNPIVTSRTSGRIEFNESAIRLFKCFTLWEAGEYITNILLFLMDPTVQNYKEIVPLSYEDLELNLKQDLQLLNVNVNPNVSIVDCQQMLQIVSRYDYTKLFIGDFISNRETILNKFSNFIRLHFSEDTHYRIDETGDHSRLKYFENISQELVNEFKSFIPGVEEYHELLIYFRDDVTLQLIGSGLKYESYKTQLFKSERVRQYRTILERVFSTFEIYNTMVFYNPIQYGGRSTVITKRTIPRPLKISKTFKISSNISSLWQHYQKQYSNVENHEAFYDKTHFTEYFLNKLRSYYEKDELDELSELIFVFLIKMNLEKDRFLYYETERMNRLSSKSTSKTPSAPVKTTRRTKKSSTPPHKKSSNKELMKVKILSPIAEET